MKTAFLFPGQGAQSPGMGKELYHTYYIYKETFDRCSEGAGIDLKKACFDGERLGEGEVVQPAIFAHSMATLAVLRSEGINADVTAGLSLGEYSALTASDVFEVAQCAALVRQRGRIMDSAFEQGKGGMLSVIGFNAEQVQETIQTHEKVYIANHLSELQIVLAGYLEDLKALQSVFEQAGAKMATLLDVRGPSHAPLLNEAAGKFAEVLEKETLGKPACTVYANVLGRPYGDGSDIKQLLADQMRKRVRWHDCTEHMIGSGIEQYIEVGPGNVLGKLIKRRVGRGGASVVSVKDLASLKKLISV